MCSVTDRWVPCGSLRRRIADGPRQRLPPARHGSRVPRMVCGRPVDASRKSPAGQSPSRCEAIRVAATSTVPPSPTTYALSPVCPVDAKQAGLVPLFSAPAFALAMRDGPARADDDGALTGVVPQMPSRVSLVPLGLLRRPRPAVVVQDGAAGADGVQVTPRRTPQACNQLVLPLSIGTKAPPFQCRIRPPPPTTKTSLSTAWMANRLAGAGRYGDKGAAVPAHRGAAFPTANHSLAVPPMANRVRLVPVGGTGFAPQSDAAPGHCRRS